MYYRWLREPEPPVINVGKCGVKGPGALEIGNIHLVPSSTSESVIVSFSTNLPTNGLITVQYGTDQGMQFETFATSSEVPVMLLYLALFDIITLPYTVIPLSCCMYMLG